MAKRKSSVSGGMAPSSSLAAKRNSHEVGEEIISALYPDLDDCKLDWEPAPLPKTDRPHTELRKDDER